MQSMQRPCTSLSSGDRGRIWKDKHKGYLGKIAQNGWKNRDFKETEKKQEFQEFQGRRNVWLCHRQNKLYHLCGIRQNILKTWKALSFMWYKIKYTQNVDCEQSLSVPENENREMGRGNGGRKGRRVRYMHYIFYLPHWMSQNITDLLVKNLDLGSWNL